MATSFERLSIAANEKTEAERFSKPGAPDEPAGSVDAIIDDEDEAEIRKRAHAIWDAEGQPDRLELDHWLRARCAHPTKS
jgi:hypothetical protein